MASSTSTADVAARPAARTFADRLLAALPLLSIYVWLCIVYCVEVWARATPWLFSDELEMTQLSRSIAATGIPAERGQQMSPHSLYTVLTAPVWLIEHVPTAYAGVKYLDVFVMTAAVFPTYLLARMVVGRRAALFAAAGAGVLPSLAYTGYLVEENLAYPYAALCFWLVARALVAPRRGTVAWAAAACVVAPAVRGELVVVPLLALLAALFALWSSDWGRERRRSWSSGDWAGVTALVLGAIFLISGVASHQSLAWLETTRLYKHQILNMTGWAAGALAIGMGIVPFVGGLAALGRLPGERGDRALRMFRCVVLSALIAFGLYTGMKAAYLSKHFATRVEERNLIYVAPLLFIGTAILLDRRRVNRLALLAAGVFVTYLVGYAVYHPTQFPYEMQVALYSDALGLAILQAANRYLAWTPENARVLVLAVAVAGTAALAALPLLRSRVRAASGLTAVLAVGVLAWSLTGQVAAAAGSNRAGRQAAETLRHPFSWVDDTTGDRPTIYMGEGESDPNPENLIEFWNRSIERVSSLDGTVGGPGPAGGPNLTANGTLYWTDSPSDLGAQFDYAVESLPCVDFAGTFAGSHLYRAGGELKTWTLVRLTHPNRLRAMCTGIYPDGWTGATDSAYFRFSGGAHGWLRIVVSREEWGGPTPPSPVHVLVGKLVINDNDQPILGDVVHTYDSTIASNRKETVWVRAPSQRFAVHVVIDKKFVPHDYDPNNGDVRELGAQVTYQFFATRPRGAKASG